MASSGFVSFERMMDIRRKRCSLVKVSTMDLQRKLALPRSFSGYSSKKCTSEGGKSASKLLGWILKR